MLYDLAAVGLISGMLALSWVCHRLAKEEERRCREWSSRDVVTAMRRKEGR